MKKILTIGLTLCLLVAFPAVAQDEAIAAYDQCVSGIRKHPQDAYEPCRKYLEHPPREQAQHIEYVKQWISQYQKVSPYVQFLQGLAPDPTVPFFVYEPDLNIDLPQTPEKEGPYKIEISRSFGDSYEEGLLRKAEAVYSSPGKMIDDVFKSLDYWANESSLEMSPIWGMRGNDEIQSTDIVTARAVRYYYDLTLAVRRNSHLPSGFDAVSTNLKYTAAIKHYDRYSHNKDTFENVYVADLNLEWGFVCGGLCGMGFTRNKIVVLDSKGDVIGMYLDAPINAQSWVS